jgi:hypothetical protein
MTGMLLNNYLMFLDYSNIISLLDYFSNYSSIFIDLELRNIIISLTMSVISVIGIPIILRTSTSGKILDTFVKGVVTGSGIAVGKYGTDKILKGKTNDSGNDNNNKISGQKDSNNQTDSTGSKDFTDSTAGNTQSSST